MSGAEGTKSLRQDVSNAIVGWYRERFGRGPTQSKVYIENDHVLVILGNVQTPVEQTLAANGQGELVTQVRRTVKAVHRDQLIELVEGMVGRGVRAMHTDHDPDTDTSVYVFLLASAD